MKNRQPLLISLLITLSLFFGILILYFKLQPQVPIFYSLARNSQHLVAKEWLFLFPAISLLITLTHFTILRMIQKSDELLIKLFTWMTIGIQLLLGVALLRIILIIT